MNHVLAKFSQTIFFNRAVPIIQPIDRAWSWRVGLGCKGGYFLHPSAV